MQYLKKLAPNINDEHAIEHKLNCQQQLYYNAIATYMLLNQLITN